MDDITTPREDAANAGYEKLAVVVDGYELGELVDDLMNVYKHFYLMWLNPTTNSRTRRIALVTEDGTIKAVYKRVRSAKECFKCLSDQVLGVTNQAGLFHEKFDHEAEYCLGEHPSEGFASSKNGNVARGPKQSMARFVHGELPPEHRRYRN